MDSNNVGGLTALFDKASGLSGTERVNLETGVAVAVSKGRELVSVKKFLDEFATKPDRRVGTDKVQSLQSFIEWVNRHKDQGTVVFCDATRTAPKLLAVADYHHANSDTEGGITGDAAARFGKFRALYEFPISSHWKAWSDVNRKIMDQADFAEFLDDHALDLISPEMVDNGKGEMIASLPPEVAQYLGYHGGRMALPNDVLALAKGLEITANAKNVARVDVQSGQTALMYEETHVDGRGQRVEVPKMFMIGVPLFDRAATAYRVPIRIRYRLPGGIKWILTMFGDEQIVDKAITDAAKSVHTECEVPVFLGTPG